MTGQLGKGNWAEYQKLVLSELQKHHQELDTLDKTLVETNQRLTSIDSDIKGVQANITALLKMVRDGNGQDPLIKRVTILEHDMRTLKERESEGIENSRFTWQTVIAILGLLIALISAAVAIF